jgi:hypothetical protein
LDEVGDVEFVFGEVEDDPSAFQILTQYLPLLLPAAEHKHNDRGDM